VATAGRAMTARDRVEAPDDAGGQGRGRADQARRREGGARRGKGIARQARGRTDAGEIAALLHRDPCSIDGRIGKSLLTVGASSALQRHTGDDRGAGSQSASPFGEPERGACGARAGSARRYPRGREGVSATRQGPALSEPGKVDFVDVQVNTRTDAVNMRATFPNPDGLLVDGQLVTRWSSRRRPSPPWSCRSAPFRSTSPAPSC